ncbi:MAG: hypothetical protein DRI54_04755 [Bacteroidetes bacterium]|nr:MAG: hypothetical protein DRI54_04755 [Bacteroidota bacterium]
MKSLKIALFTVVALVSPFVSFAHEGHGVVNDSSVLHYLSSSLHLAPVLMVAAVAVFFVIRYKRKASVK